ncbi:MAG: hypothetical protein AAF125_10085, partial [Chloroflexota bacterium]
MTDMTEKTSETERINVPGTLYSPPPPGDDTTLDEAWRRRKTLKLFAGATGDELVQEIATYLNNSGYT